jgi:hypothetical protein
MRHSIIGILLQYYSLANGDMSKVKIETPSWRPYIIVILNGVYSTEIEAQRKAFNEYLEEVCNVAEERLPRVSKECDDLVATLPNI